MSQKKDETTLAGWFGFGIIAVGTVALFVWLARRPGPPPDPRVLELQQNVSAVFSAYVAAERALEIADPGRWNPF